MTPLKAAVVKCDKCTWKKENEVVQDWHNKQCPECADCIIITDEDMVIVRATDALREAGIVKSYASGDDTTGVGLDVTLDTAALRAP